MKHVATCATCGTTVSGKSNIHRCQICGVSLCGKHTRQYTDGAYAAISRNSPKLCVHCYRKQYPHDVDVFPLPAREVLAMSRRSETA